MAFRLVIIVCFATLVHQASADPMFGGENVCNETRYIVVQRMVDKPIEYELTVNGMCGILPCKRKRIETRMDSRLEETHEKVEVATCCRGYTETPTRQCAPICLNACHKGKCIAPNVCECNPAPTDTAPGFVGSLCNRFACAAANRWGSKCDKECNCPATAYCSASTGKCLCRSGWRGANCTEECTPSMNCDDVELPPIIEPDTNVIPDDHSPQRLVLTQYRDSEDGRMQTNFNYYATNISTHLFLISLVAFLFYAAIKYKRRYDRVRNELYYTGGTGSASNNSSNYSVYSQNTNRSMNRGPQMPRPDEPNYLEKNMSFAAATRNVVLKGSLQPTVLEQKMIPGAKAEMRLLKNQEVSQPNLYTDIDTIIERARESNKNHSIAIDTIEEDHYVVPRSPNSSGLNSSIVSGDALMKDIELYENNEENLYEEIKPRLPPANGDRK